MPSSFSFPLSHRKEGLNIACTVLTKTVTACRRLNRHVAALIWSWTYLPFPDNLFFRSKSREDTNRQHGLGLQDLTNQSRKTKACNKERSYRS